MIENQSNFTTDSVVRNTDFTKRFNNARENFKMLHGCDIFDIPDRGSEYVINFLNSIKNEK